jgi:hypothetical protein
VSFRSRAPLARLALVASILAAGCERPAPDARKGGGDAGPEFGHGIHFVDATAEAGIGFTHRSGRTGRRHLPETMGGGAAWFDADGDGDHDLFLVQSGGLADAGDAFDDATNALYRNDGGRFVALTDAAAARTGYGQGVAAGDADGDARVDLYVTNYGPNALLRNVTTGSAIAFEEGAAAAGIDDAAWSVSASFFDGDGDGDLDLYVANYVAFALTDYRRLSRDPSGFIAYPHPDLFPAARDTLYRNDGTGRFDDVTTASGIVDVDGKGLGVATADFDLDGDADVYVANDSTPNFLFRNDGGLRFTDVTARSNSGYNKDGETEAGMGVAFGDVEGDLDVELFVTNLDQETNTLYAQVSPLVFDDVTAARGLASPSLPFVGFGTVFLDLEMDGDPDLVIANGHILDNLDGGGSGDAKAAQRMLAHLNDGKGRFLELGDELPAALATPRAARALAFADYDSDLDVDLLVAVNEGPAVLLRNETRRSGKALVVRTVDERGRDLDCAYVRYAIGGVERVALPSRGSSYAASNDPRIWLTGEGERVERLLVRFLDGREVVREDVPLGDVLTIAAPAR